MLQTGEETRGLSRSSCPFSRHPRESIHYSGDGRTAFTIGAIFRIPTGEARIRSEIEYPGVSTASRDIRRCGFEKLRVFPTHTAVLLSATWLSEALSRNCICPFCCRRSRPVA